MSKQSIGRYDIIAKIGRGGMGEVYRALDPHFKREVALKILSDDFAQDPKLRQRFELEARTIASLEHAAIVPVYDFGEDDGQLYLVMRLMTSGTLHDRLRSGPLSLDETERILRPVAMALDAAHGRGLIHRDIKPANILFDESDAPYLTDFGIVKLVGGSSATLTATGGLLGTPAYMSPEQIRGDSIDGRSDIYALGVVLFEMLAGRQPYEATTPIGQAFKHVNEPVPELPRDPRGEPSGQQVVIDTAMAKNRNDRYAAAGQMVTALNHSRTVPPPVRPGSNGETLPDTPPAADLDKRTVPVWAWVAGGIATVLLIAFLANLIFGGGDNGAQNKPDSGTTPAIVAGEELDATEPVPTAETASPTAVEKQEEVLPPTTIPSPVPTEIVPMETPIPTRTTAPTSTVESSPTPGAVFSKRPAERTWQDIDSIWSLTEFEDMQTPGTQLYSITISPGDVLRWSFSWCALDKSRLREILAPLSSVRMLVDGAPLTDSQLLQHDVTASDGWECRYWSTILEDWQSGSNVQLEVDYQLRESIFDGTSSYSPGDYHQVILATVR